MFKFTCLLVLAVAAVLVHAKPNPNLLVAAPVATTYEYPTPVAAVYEQTFHGNIAPFTGYAAAPTTYLGTPPVAVAYAGGWEPFVAAGPGPLTIIQ